MFGNSSYRADLIFRCDLNTLFGAVLQAAPAVGFKVTNADNVNYVISLSKGMSLFTWGENITVSMGVCPDGSSGLTIVSSSKLGTEIAAGSQNRKNAELLANQLCMMLPGQPILPAPPAGTYQ